MAKISDEDFPSNSKTSKQSNPAERVQKKIISGEVIQRKKSLGTRILETFSVERNQTVGEYVVLDILVPALRDLIYDVGVGGLAQALGMNAGAGRARRRSLAGEPTDYTTFGKGKPKALSARARANHEFDEIIIDSRGEAEEILDKMRELTETYGSATVSDLLGFVGQTATPQDRRWGWTEAAFAAAYVSHIREGYLLELPRTVQID